MPASVPNIGFDLVWAMALGLNKTAERVAQLDDSVLCIMFDGLSVSHMFYNVCRVFLLNRTQNENICLNSLVSH